MLQQILHKISWRHFIILVFASGMFFGCAANLPKDSEITQALPQTFQNTALISVDMESQPLAKASPIEQMNLLFNDSTLQIFLKLL